MKDPENTIYPLLSQTEKPTYDNPCYVGGIAGVFDFKNQSYYVTFTKKKESTKAQGIIETGVAETIEYNEASNQYKGYHPTTPRLYMNYMENFFSPDPATNYKIYAMDEGARGFVYTAFQDSIIRFVSNPQPVVAKWFDNQSIAINNKTASTKLKSGLFAVQDYAPQTIDFQTDGRWKWLQAFVRYPTRGIDAPTRLRGNSMVTELRVMNDADDIVVRFSNVVTDWRTSPKI